MLCTFQKVSASRTIKVACIACGKRVRRVLNEWQTVNPYNTMPDGTPKTELQIVAELPAMLDKAEAKLAKRAICRACEKAGHRINFSGEHLMPAGDAGSGT